MRPNRDQYFLEIARTVAKRSTCPRGEVGAVLVSGNTIVGVGYNGAPPGWRHCTEAGCYLVKGNDGKDRCARIVHAEINAIIRQFSGIGVNKDLYCTHSPCYSCYLALASAKVVTIFYAGKFVDPTRDRLMLDAVGGPGLVWLPY